MSPYIIVTPAKNEDKKLPKLILSIMHQTVKPLIWVIVDDGSTDNTLGIIKKVEEKYDWIKCIRLNGCTRSLDEHVYHVYNSGFDFAVKYCETHNIQYKYIGSVDADMILETQFYEKIIKEFENNPKLGIASGSGYINNKMVIDTREDNPLGGLRLWRKECYEETGGYPFSYSADSVSVVLAKLRGWETKRFGEIKAVQTRMTSNAEGLWKGYKMHGESAFFRNYHPLFVLVKGIKITFEKQHYIGIAYLYGYLRCVMRRIDKIDSKEVRDYYYHQKYKEAIEYYKNVLRNKINVFNKRG